MEEIKATFAKIRTREEIRAVLEDLYRSGVEVLKMTGEDTQYAPARNVLDIIERETLDEIGVRNMLENYKAGEHPQEMVIHVLNWVLGECEKPLPDSAYPNT